MLQATVVCAVTATVKHASMEGWKLLLVQPLAADGRAPDGDPQLAIDAIGAGKGDAVVITSDGKQARSLIGAEDTPVRWSVIGLQDEQPRRPG